MLDLSVAPVINDLIKSAIENCGEKFHEYKYEVLKIDTQVGNILGDIYHINVHGRTENGDSKYESFFMKAVPGDGAIRKALSSMLTLVYEREIFVYRDLSVVINKLQNDFHVPTFERYLITNYLAIHDEEPHETIILENLKSKGYETFPRVKPITLTYMNSAIKHLAKFHAFSWILQKYNPEFYDNEIKTKKEKFFTYWHRAELTDKQKMEFEMLLQDIEEAVKEEHCDKIMNWSRSEDFKRVFDKVITSTYSDVNILCHGDYRTENIFVKFNENDDVTHVMPIDFQLIHYGPPVNDIIYLIYSATHAGLRRPNIESWLNIYRKSFEEFLKYFDIVAEEVYPEKKFKQDFRENKIYGLFIAVKLLPIITLDPDEVNFTVDDMFKGNGKFDFNKLKNEVFKERIRDIVEEFVDEGYI